VVGARIVDFLIGHSGNKWIKEYLVFRPWYHLQLVQPLETINKAATLFANTTRELFGEKFLSLRALIVSWLIAPFLALLIQTISYYLRLRTPYVSGTRTFWGEHFAWYGSLLIINPVFDLVSFAFTRYLAEIIADSKRLLYALTFWIVDVICCLIIAIVSYECVNSFLTVVAPDYSVSLWLGKYAARGLAVVAALTGFVPTLLHVVFFVTSLALAAAETFRRAFCKVFERFDESNDRALTIVATMVAAFIGFLGALVTVLR
jgi:hypothetical protein